VPKSVTASGEGLISIGQLAAETGVSSRTIRYYEELGILPEPPRTAGGTRKYGPEYRFYVEGAVALKELGFSLEEIKLVGRLTLGRPMTPRQAERAAAAIAEKRELLERKVQVLDRLRDVLGDREDGVVSSADLRELADVLNGDE
jgi:DNA-binding transcriptional MerR regulator